MLLLLLVLVIAIERRRQQRLTSFGFAGLDFARVTAAVSSQLFVVSSVALIIGVRYVRSVSLAEIEKAVATLSPAELSRLAAFIARQENLAWDKQLAEDFSRGGKHEKALDQLDAEIDAGNFTPLP